MAGFVFTLKSVNNSRRVNSAVYSTALIYKCRVTMKKQHTNALKGEKEILLKKYSDAQNTETNPVGVPLSNVLYFHTAGLRCKCLFNVK